MSYLFRSSPSKTPQSKKQTYEELKQSIFEKKRNEITNGNIKSLKETATVEYNSGHYGFRESKKKARNSEISSLEKEITNAKDFTEFKKFSNSFTPTINELNSKIMADAANINYNNLNTKINNLETKRKKYLNEKKLEKFSSEFMKKALKDLGNKIQIKKDELQKKYEDLKTTLTENIKTTNTDKIDDLKKLHEEFKKIYNKYIKKLKADVHIKNLNTLTKSIQDEHAKFDLEVNKKLNNLTKNRDSNTSGKRISKIKSYIKTLEETKAEKESLTKKKDLLQKLQNKLTKIEERLTKDLTKKEKEITSTQMEINKSLLNTNDYKNIEKNIKIKKNNIYNKIDELYKFNFNNILSNIDQIKTNLATGNTEREERKKRQNVENKAVTKMQSIFRERMQHKINKEQKIKELNEIEKAKIVLKKSEEKEKKREEFREEAKRLKSKANADATAKILKNIENAKTEEQKLAEVEENRLKVEALAEAKAKENRLKAEAIEKAEAKAKENKEKAEAKANVERKAKLATASQTENNNDPLLSAISGM